MHVIYHLQLASTVNTYLQIIPVKYRYYHKLQLKMAFTGQWQQLAYCHLLPLCLQYDWSLYDHCRI